MINSQVELAWFNITVLSRGLNSAKAFWCAPVPEDSHVMFRAILVLAAKAMVMFSSLHGTHREVRIT